MPAAGNLVSSSLAAAMDPRVDEQAVADQMQDDVVEEPQEPLTEAEVAAADADQDDHRPG